MKGMHGAPSNVKLRVTALGNFCAIFQQHERSSRQRESESVAGSAATGSEVAREARSRSVAETRRGPTRFSLPPIPESGDALQ